MYNHDNRQRGKGRPDKFDIETVNRILAAVEMGATYKLACSYAGITHPTFRRWMLFGERQADRLEMGEEFEPDPFYHFYMDVRKSESLDVIRCLKNINKASDNYWQAAAWKLERRHPQEYGRIAQESQKDKDGKPIESNGYSELSDDERFARIEQIYNTARTRRAVAANGDRGKEPEPEEATPRPADPGLLQSS